MTSVFGMHIIGYIEEIVSLIEEMVLASVYMVYEFTLAYYRPI